VQIRDKYCTISFIGLAPSGPAGGTYSATLDPLAGLTEKGRARKGEGRKGWKKEGN